MSKGTTILFFLLIMLMMGGMGFLGKQFSDFQDKYYAEKNAQQKDTIDAEEVHKTIEGFKKTIAAQQEMLKEFSASITKLSKELKTVAKIEYMPAPEFSLKDQIFQANSGANNQIKVVGDKDRYNQWIADNDLFLEPLVKKTIPLDYDRSRRQVVIQDLIQGSVFEQMGLKKGDGILSVNGKSMFRGPDIREALLLPKNKQILVSRNNKRLVLDVSFVEKPKKDAINLSISKQQFDAALPKLLSTLKLEPALKDGDALGVKIVNLEDNNVFSLMKLQAHDVITKINGDYVTDNKFVTVLKSAASPLEIDFVRGDQNKKVVVEFQ